MRNGWSCQVPARRAMERDDDVVAGWVKEVWSKLCCQNPQHELHSRAAVACTRRAIPPLGQPVR
ncbi:winged helix-turn-helix domain-containing protein [Streptomyces sp. NPDC005727]|uniref:winged helix-turn-helix domain-containing protein n=1 Tax=Streptomyces sp. NPDC005727 TaxID=3157053 RepID=UPI0033D12D50